MTIGNPFAAIKAIVSGKKFSEIKASLLVRDGRKEAWEDAVAGAILVAAGSPIEEELRALDQFLVQGK